MQAERPKGREKMKSVFFSHIIIYFVYITKKVLSKYIYVVAKH